MGLQHTMLFTSLIVSSSLRVELVWCVCMHVLMLGIWSSPGMHNTSMYTTFNLFNLNICYVCGSYQCPYCPNFNIATAIKATITLLCLISGFLMQRYYVLRSWCCCAWECVNGFDWEWVEVKDTIIFSSGKSRIVFCSVGLEVNKMSGFHRKRLKPKGLEASRLFWGEKQKKSVDMFEKQRMLDYSVKVCFDIHNWTVMQVYVSEGSYGCRMHDLERVTYFQIIIACLTLWLQAWRFSFARRHLHPRC